MSAQVTSWSAAHRRTSSAVLTAASLPPCVTSPMRSMLMCAPSFPWLFLSLGCPPAGVVYWDAITACATASAIR